MIYSLNHYIKQLENKNDIGIRTDAEIAEEIKLLDNYIPQKVDYDIFISYRKGGGRDTARTVKQQLQLLGYNNIFFDCWSLQQNTQILFDFPFQTFNFVIINFIHQNARRNNLQSIREVT